MTSPLPVPGPAPAGLPRRDVAARTVLADVAGRTRPVTAAHERLLAVSGALGARLPGGGLRRGATVTVGGAVGAGATSVVLALAAAAAAAGEWVAVVEAGETFGALAAAEAGVDLRRCAVVRRVPAERWATVVAALLDGIGLVCAEVPRGVRAADARRLVARARERDVVLVAVEREATWPAEAALRIRAGGGAWSGLAAGEGVLDDRTVRVAVTGRGVAPDAAGRGAPVALVRAG